MTEVRFKFRRQGEEVVKILLVPQAALKDTLSSLLLV